MGALVRAERWLAAVESVSVVALVVAVVLAVLTQVVMRYVFARPNAWTEELSRFCFIWLSLLGASLAGRRGSHFVFDQVVTSLPDWVQRRIAQLIMVLMIVSLAGVTILGIQLANLARFERSAALDLPVVWVYAALPAAAVCMMLHIVLAPIRGEQKDSPWPSR